MNDIHEGAEVRSLTVDRVVCSAMRNLEKLRHAHTSEADRAKAVTNIVADIWQLGAFALNPEDKR